MFLRKTGAVFIFAALFILLGHIATAQSPAPPSPSPSATPRNQTDELAKSLNLTAEAKSLPLWSQPATEAVNQLAQAVRTSTPSIFQVGKSDVGTGTAFLISKKNRLLATNAHVADIFNEGKTEMLAYQNGTSNAFKVVKVYYHPGVLRLSAGVILRTANPSTGNVVPRSPDVAVLQLGDGPDLPDELPLASREEIYDLFAQPIAMLGYPGTDNNGLPGVGQKAEASFREGVVDRISDFSNYAGGPPDRQQYLQHSMANWYGFSGSPIFLPNGHVVALNNSGITETQNGLSTTLAWGIRADCLWELLKANNLLDKVNVPPEAASVDVDRFSQPDPEVEQLQKVNQLLADARNDLKFSRYQAAIDKCSQTAKQLPSYAAVYRTRGGIYMDFAALAFNPKDPQSRQYNQLALDDEKRAVELDPVNVSGYLEIAMANCNLANFNSPKRVGDPSAILLADKIITDPSVSAVDRTYAYRVRANGMGFSPDSLAYLQKADSISPSDTGVNWSLGIYYTVNKNPQEAERCKTLSRTLLEATGQSNTAFHLAADPDDTKRDGHRAFQLASQACISTNYTCYFALAALAAAYAECGDFNHAIEYQKKALQLAPEYRRDAYTQRLASFQEFKPWRIP